MTICSHPASKSEYWRINYYWTLH